MLQFCRHRLKIQQNVEHCHWFEHCHNTVFKLIQDEQK